MITCLLLTAGESTRFGSPKALATLNEETVIQHVQKTLISSDIDEVIVVLGAHRQQITPFLLKHKKLKIVYNKDYFLGQTSSFKAGLHSVSGDTKAFFLLPIDYPLVKTDTLNILIRHFIQNHPRILIPVFDHKKGHPPLISMEIKNELLHIDISQGINKVLQEHPTETILLPVQDDGVVLSFNNTEEFNRIKKIYNAK